MIENWIIVWKIVFSLGLSLFAVLAVWVAIQGGLELKKFLKSS